MKLPPGSVLLLPSYHCGVEVEAVLRGGAQVAFYRVRRDMSIDAEDLMRRMTPSTKAVMVIHYFGFPQHIETLLHSCREKGIYLIEDCAHGLYSQFSDGRWVGTLGDVGAFSFQKTVFLPNGGGLLLNRSSPEPPAEGQRHFDLDIVKAVLRSALDYELAAGGGLARALRAIRPKLGMTRRHHPTGSRAETPVRGEGGTPASYDAPRFGYDKGMSFLSSFLLEKEPWFQIRNRRRQNYLSLLQSLASIAELTPVFRDLPDGVCPLGLPVYVDRRPEVDFHGRAAGVEAYIFGRQPHPRLAISEFPEAEYLAKNVLCLPVHQQLQRQDLEFIAEAARRAAVACRAAQ